MKKIVLTFGLISGAILAAMMAIIMPLCMNGTIDFDNAEIIGYTTMVLSFIAVFFGIRTYRENAGRGAITFGKAFQVGILITVISSVVYVLSWEIVYFNFLPDFVDKYAAATISKMQDAGATPAAVAAKKTEMDTFKELYKNPLFNVGMTFLEVFPVGLIVTLVSAAILRKKPTPNAPATAAAAALT
jgi:hypothetical protein